MYVAKNIKSLDLCRKCRRRESTLRSWQKKTSFNHRVHISKVDYYAIKHTTDGLLNVYRGAAINDYL